MLRHGGIALFGYKLLAKKKCKRGVHCYFHVKQRVPMFNAEDFALCMVFAFFALLATLTFVVLIALRIAKRERTFVTRKPLIGWTRREFYDAKL